MDILLLLCLLAGELWSFLFSLLVVKRVMPRKIGKLVGCWQEKFGWSESSKILRAVTLCLVENLEWYNCWTFEVGLSPIVIKFLSFMSLFNWTNSLASLL